MMMLKQLVHTIDIKSKLNNEGFYKFCAKFKTKAGHSKLLMRSKRLLDHDWFTRINQDKYGS